MPVVINEFEVVAEPQPTTPPSSPAPSPSAEPPTPYEIDRLVRRQLERLARIWAH